MSAQSSPGNAEASENITNRIKELGDWRADTLAWVRQLIHEADPEIQEGWKWRGVPTWEHDGIVCTGESYKLVVKLTFAQGASVPDPHKLFNSSLEGNVRRAIDIAEGARPDAIAFQELIRSAVAVNAAAVERRAAAKKKPKA